MYYSVKPFTFSLPSMSGVQGDDRERSLPARGLRAHETFTGSGRGTGPPRELPDSPPPAQTPAADTKPRAGREGAAHGAPRPRESGRGDGSRGSAPSPQPGPAESLAQKGTERRPRRVRRKGEGAATPTFQRLLQPLDHSSKSFSYSDAEHR